MRQGRGSVRPKIVQGYREHRPYLTDPVFPMLGDIGAADDAVQGAFARLMRSNYGKIENERGWLSVVTSRLCLDQIRSAGPAATAPTTPARSS
jgi:RNA polymerase sigma-70 factor (ECF subfamily)